MLTNDQIEHLIDETIRREGGLVFTDHPLDRGGPTFAGITQRAWERYLRKFTLPLPRSVRDLTPAHVRAFYRNEHIEPFAWIDDFDLAALLIDSGIHHGVRVAIEWLQRAAGATLDGIAGPQTRERTNGPANSPYGKTDHFARLHREVFAARLAYIATIVRNDPSQSRWLLGWVRRVCEFLR